MRLLLILAIIACGCGEAELETVRIALRSPQAIDPAQIASVGIAVVHELSTSCVTGAGSNQCVSIQTIAAATQSPGFVRQIALTPSGGSSGLLDGLPFGRTCFIAEALSANQTSLASGCAEVTLQLEKQKVEIELQSP